MTTLARRHTTLREFTRQLIELDLSPETPVGTIFGEECYVPSSVEIKAVKIPFIHDTRPDWTEMTGGNIDIITVAVDYER